MRMTADAATGAYREARIAFIVSISRCWPVMIPCAI
jgi:hypothetical protein